MPGGDVPGPGAGLAGEFRRTWRPEPVVLVSALPPEVALRRLADGVGRPGDPGTSRYDPQLRVVKGFVTPSRVRLYATTVIETRNSWRPVFDGRLTASGTGGSELTGSLGPAPGVAVLTRVLVSLGGLFFLGGLAGTAISLAAGHLHAATFPAAFAGAALVLVIFVAVLSVLGTRQGRADGRHLRAWLGRTLLAEPGT